MARQSKNKIKQLKILLIVDGVTEERYFKNILQRYKMAANDVKKVSPSGGQAVSSSMSEAHSFETAMRKQYSNYYIVIDRDNISRAEFDHIRGEADQRQNVTLIFSNVSFEVWLLAHYQRMTARPVDADADNARYRRELSNYLDAPYKKGDGVQLDKIISLAEHPIDTAFNNTSAIQELDYDYQCTNVGPFLRQLVANR